MRGSEENEGKQANFASAKFSTPPTDRGNRARKRARVAGARTPARKSLFQDEPDQKVVTRKRSKKRKAGASHESLKKRLFPAASSDAPVDGQKTMQVSKMDSEISPAIKHLYRTIQRATGATGGYGHSGPIYGEITAGSFQKILNYLQQYFHLGKTSSFLDIGAGLGKPNLHALIDPGVQLSFGIELEQLRWTLSLHNLKQCLQQVPCLKDGSTPPNCVFAKADATTLGSLEPFTHVYMFDTGFPPDALKAIAVAFNLSESVTSLVCFHKPKDIIEKCGFNVVLHGKVSTRMSGSTEGHTAFVYAPIAAGRPRLQHVEQNSKPASVFQTGIELLKGMQTEGPQTAAVPLASPSPVTRYVSWLDQQLDEHLYSKRPSRERKKRRLFS